MGTDELADRLTAALADRLGAARVEIANLTRLSGGASRETWSFDATVDRASPQPCVLQRERPGGGRSGPGMAAEATLLRLAAAEGVPVPRLIASDEGRDDLGAPFLVTERVDGETIPRRLLRDDAYASARPKVAFEAGAALARIHQISAAELGDRMSAQDQVEQFRSVLDMFGEPHPAFELGFRWLERNRPVEAGSGPDALVVVHGDFRTGNLIVDGEGLRAVLDWELAHLGHRAEDLGWFCVRAWRFGSPHRAGGFGPVEDLLAGYRSVDGVEIDPATLQWYEALGTLKWGVMCLVQSHSHLSGVSRSVELATIGRRTCENEFDLFELIR